MKKILFISLALVMALSIGLIGCDGDGGNGGPVVPPTSIKIGLVRDISYGILTFYDYFAGGPLYRAFNATVNGGGGIYMSGYNATLPLELIIKDYNPTAPGDLTTQTIAAITTDKVHFLWGCPGTTCIYTQASLSNTYDILYLTFEGGATDMMSDPAKLSVWPYTFINLAFSDWYQLPVLYKMLLEQSLAQNRTSPKAYVLYIDNEHGREYRDVMMSLCGAGNVTAQGHDQYTADITDITTIVNQAKTALGNVSDPNYDIFCAFTYDPYLGMVVTAVNSTGFNPPGIIMGPGAEGGAYGLTYGSLLEGIMGFAVANNKTVITSTTTMSMDALYNLVMPYVGGGAPPAFAYGPWITPTVWAALEMWKDAVETVGHLNAGYTNAVRNILAGYSSSSPATTVLGDTWYKMFGVPGAGGGVIDYLCHTGEIGQWQNGYLEIVGYTTNITSELPKYSKTSTFWYPMTGNWTWLP